MADIIDMNGKPVAIEQLAASASQPETSLVNPAFVYMLEMLTEAAKTGHIVSFGIATVDRNGSTNQMYACAPGQNFNLLSSSVLLEKKLARYVETGSTS